MSGSKRRSDQPAGGRGGNGGRNAPGGRGFGAGSSPLFPDNRSATSLGDRGGTGDASGRSTARGDASGRSTARGDASGRSTSEGHHSGRDSTSPSASRSSFQLRFGTFDSPASSSPHPSDSSVRTARPLFPKSITDLPYSPEIVFGSATNAATSSPSSLHSSTSLEANRSPSLSPSPPPSPSFSPSRLSSGSPATLPDPGSTPGMLGPAALLNFLDTFKFPHQKCALYKAELKKLEALECYDLVVDFDHVLATDKDLALVICDKKESNAMWLKTAANIFLNANGVITQEGKISFTNLPISLRTAWHALTLPTVPNVWLNQLFKGEEEVVSCSYQGSEIWDAILVGLFKRLANGESFGGSLTLHKILMLERSEGLQAIITQQPVVHENASNEDKVLDVHGLWPMMEPFFTWGEQLPVFFEELKDVLLNATAEDVSKGWFLEFLRFFPPFVSSMGRRNFECGLHQIVNEFYLNRSQMFKDLFAEPPMIDDWRENAKRFPVLEANYNFEYRKPKNGEIGNGVEQENTLKKGNTKTDAEETEKNQMGAAEEKQAGEISKAAEEIADPEIAKALEHPYENTTWGLLGFKRNNIQHPKGDFQDIDEPEIYSSHVFPTLPKVIRQLMEICQMGGRFAGIWSSYKSSKFDSRRLPPI